MKRETLAVAGQVKISVENVNGDLQVVGWERPEITAKTSGDLLELNNEGQAVSVRCDDDLILYVAREASLSLDNISGDADIRALTGDVTIVNVSGDLQVRNVGAAKIDSVGGDLSLRSSSGNLQVGKVGSNASLRDVKGDVVLESVNSDLHLRNMEGNVTAVAGGDAILSLHPKNGTNIDVTAGCDLLLCVPTTLDAQLDLQAGAEEGIRIDLPGVTSVEEAATRKLVLGSGSATLHLVAGEDLVVTSKEGEWESKADFDPFGYSDLFSGEFPGVPADLHERISRQVEEVTQRVAQMQSARIQQRMEAAMRRAEEKLRAAERRSQFMGVTGRGRPPSPISSTPPTPPSEPVSNEERLAILKMLEDKRISVKQAEKLLSALEGK